MDPKELFLRPLRETGEKIVDLLPSILGALLVLLVGWLVARLLKAALTRLLVAVRLERFSQRTGLSRFLSRGDIKHSLADVLGTVLFWLVLLFFVYLAADVLNLTLVQDALNRIIWFVPDLVAAVVIVIIGVVLASLAKGVVSVAAGNSRLAHQELLARVVQYLVIFFAVAMALEELGVATPILVNSVLIIIAAIAFGFALAFGLGSKDLAARIVDKMLEPKETTGTEPDSTSSRMEDKRVADDES
jgi:small-conductance mechanosensitive channel